MSDSEDHIDSPDGGDDLFGDDAGDDQLSDQEQPLSDHGLESDRDGEEGYGDDDMDDGDEEGGREVKTKLVMGHQLFRHRIPKPKDGTLQILRVPPFIRWNPEEYKPAAFEASQWDLDNSTDKNPISVVRFRKDPKTRELQSNAMVCRWSDGSVTLAVGEQHYEIQRKDLAPPGNKPYQELLDGHQYAAAAHLSSNALLVVGHVTEHYRVRPNKTGDDVAVDRLKEGLANARKSTHASEGDMIIRTTQDPELQKKQAELAEKERERARRRRENAAARMEGTGGRYGRGGGLTVSDLEGGRRGAGAGRKKGMPGAQRQKRRRPEYDSDDDLPQGARRQEDYDLEDDFIAPSDEDIPEGEDDEEEELLDDDEDDYEAPRSKRPKTTEAEDEDADAEADMDDDLGPSSAAAETSRRARRHVIDDDEE